MYTFVACQGMRRGKNCTWATAVVAMTTVGMVARSGSCLSVSIELGGRVAQPKAPPALAAWAMSSLRCDCLPSESTHSRRRGQRQFLQQSQGSNSESHRLGYKKRTSSSRHFCSDTRSFGTLSRILRLEASTVLRSRRGSTWDLTRNHMILGHRDASGRSSSGGNLSGSRMSRGRPRHAASQDDDDRDDGKYGSNLRVGRQVAEAGVVYFVATPIGNLEDITIRAMNILRTADVIAAEDTRTTGSLLKLLGVERKGRLMSHHDHNTRRRVPEIIDAAREGKSVAVVSDAGTPGISDPGMELAEACAADGIRVVPVPGACAAVAAISVAGFSSHEFVFFGFVSGKRGSAMRRRKLTEIAEESRTCVMYESPHRIADTLRGLMMAGSSAQDEETGPFAVLNVAHGQSTRGVDVAREGRGEDAEERVDEDRSADVEGGRETGEDSIAAGVDTIAGSRPVILARELTKLHEEIFRGTLAEAVARYSSDDVSVDVKDPRGEFTVVLGPRVVSDVATGGRRESAATGLAALEARLMELTAGGMSTSSAVKMASKDLKMKKSAVYRVALALPSLPEKSSP